ncbi:MAG: NAD-dependent epimerase/dehydratase family protein [Candidatus Sumerlaeaceae bacterium]|nr:NAD-dependent epimerase/dehydratase family protein [Candidatus Sumerlaeaceae bacterium]
MRCLITGVSGFVGSSLCDRLLADGHEVVGVDCFVPYYARQLKDSNLAGARDQKAFRFIEADICKLFETDDEASAKKADELLGGIDVVYHQAAQAGVRASWGRDFEIYVHNNILGTQKLLEACRRHKSLRVVYASSSSVYGETRKFPMEETDVPAPVSPYGVSKLAAEHLMTLYHANYGTHTVSLRYFTVYGPRQRPDMAFHKLIASILKGEEFVLFGNGEQSRDFTFISDIVQANIDAGNSGKAGGVYNLGGGTQITMNNVIKLIESLAGKKARIKYVERHHGDVTHTGASVERARKDWGFQPKISLEEGLAREIEFIGKVVLPLGL